MSVIEASLEPRGFLTLVPASFTQSRISLALADSVLLQQLKWAILMTGNSGIQGTMV